jgi:hypothetical protein
MNGGARFVRRSSEENRPRRGRRDGGIVAGDSASVGSREEIFHRRQSPNRRLFRHATQNCCANPRYLVACDSVLQQYPTLLNGPK